MCGKSKLIEKFIPSKDIRDYIKQVDLNYWQLVDIIYLSPLDIAEKYEGLKKLLAHALQERSQELIEYCQLAVENIDKAISETQSEGVFTIEECFHDVGSKHAMSRELDSVWGNFEDALSYIQKECYTDNSDNDLRWFEITKWRKRDYASGYESVCIYSVIRGAVWYINLDDSHYESEDDFAHCLSDELYLPVPFTTGDIIEVDGYPYNPRKMILITSIGDNRDCCCVQGLSQSFEGVWRIGALKHGMIGDYRFPMIAPLFTAQRVKGLGKKIDNTLKRVSDFIKDDEAKANQLEMLIPLEGITDDELNMFLDLELDEKRIETYL